MMKKMSPFLVETKEKNNLLSEPESEVVLEDSYGGADQLSG